MVQTLEDIRGGGGSIKLGTTGTISALMSRELQSKQKVPSLAGDETSTTLKSEASADEASSSVKFPQNPRRKHNASRTPMLKSDDVTVNGTPTMKKPVKQHSGLVEIVDVKCGIPITHRLKKLGFSKLSD